MITPFDTFTFDPNGVCLIEASAGTGKTWNITSIYLRLLIENPQLTGANILVVTFTEAATLELKTRIRKVLADACVGFSSGQSDDPLIATFLAHYGTELCARQVPRLLMEKNNIDLAAIMTIHGFCHQLLTDFAFETRGGFAVEIQTDSTPLLQEIADHFWRERVLSLPPVFQAYISAQKTTPDRLLEIIVNGLNKFNLTFIPAAEIADFSEFEASLSPAFNALSTAWKRDHHQIINILKDASGVEGQLKRQRYHETRICEWDNVISFWINRHFSLIPPDELHFFCADQLAKATKKGKQCPPHHFFDLAEDYWRQSAVWATRMKTSYIALIQEFFAYVQNRMTNAKEKLHWITFDDLLFKVHAALKQPEFHESITSLIRARYPVALIDEFQDTDPLQLEIFELLFLHPDSRLIMIGDPKQAVYSFRGADIYSYLTVKQRCARHYSLNVNRRSVTPLVAAINQLFGNVEHPFIIPEITFTPSLAGAASDNTPLTERNHSRSPFQIWSLPGEGDDEESLSRDETTTQLGYAIANEIITLLSTEKGARIGERPLGLNDFAILVRTNRQALAIKEILDASQIPTVITSSQSVFDTMEARELELILAALAAPEDTGLIRAALLTELMGYSVNDLDRFNENESGWDMIQEQFDRCLRDWQPGRFAVIFGEFSRALELPQRLLRFHGGERRLTNLFHLVDLLQDASAEYHLSTSGLLQWLHDKRQDKCQLQEYDLRLDKDSDAVRILTIHKSKGLEFPIVFCPFAWEPSRKITKSSTFFFHRLDENNRYQLYLDLGSAEREQHREMANRESLAEEMRLLYVAITRAIHRCYLAWKSVKPESPSALSHLLFPVATATANVNASPTAKEIQAGDSADVIPLALRPWCEFHQLTSIRAPRIYHPEPQTSARELFLLSFTGAIETNWRITSFTALSRTETHYQSIVLEDDVEIESIAEPVTDSLSVAEASDSIFNYPAGAIYGNLMHNLLEEYEYSCRDGKTLIGLIESLHRRYGLVNLERFYPALIALIERIISTPLGTSDDLFCLKDCAAHQRLHEMEFYLPLQLIHSQDLHRLFAGHETLSTPEMLRQSLAHLDFHPVKGMLKGYIDLIVQHGNQFFVIDWKSNRLGGQPGDYAPAYLEAEMARHHYHLQYHLYLLALHQYLKLRLPDYNYDQHIGGVYYLFLRGIEAEPKSRNGIYFDRPSRHLIEALARRLVKRTGN